MKKYGSIVLLIFMLFTIFSSSVMAFEDKRQFSTNELLLLSSLPTAKKSSFSIGLDTTEIAEVINQDIQNLELKNLNSKEKNILNSIKSHKKETLQIQVFEGINNSQVVNKIMMSPKEVKQLKIPLTKELKLKYLKENFFVIPYSIVITTFNSTSVYNFDQYYINDLTKLTDEEKSSILQYIYGNSLQEKIPLNFSNNLYNNLTLGETKSSVNFLDNNSNLEESNESFNYATFSETSPVANEPNEELAEEYAEPEVIEEPSVEQSMPEENTNPISDPDGAGCIACVGYSLIKTVYEDKWTKVAQVHGILGVDTSFSLSRSTSSTSSIQSKTAYKGGSVEVSGSKSVTYNSTVYFPTYTGGSKAAAGKYALTSIRYVKKTYRHPNGSEYTTIAAYKVIGGSAWGSYVYGNGQAFNDVSGPEFYPGGGVDIGQTSAKTHTAAVGLSAYGTSLSLNNTMNSTSQNLWKFKGKTGFGFAKYKVYNEPTVNNLTAR